MDLYADNQDLFSNHSNPLNLPEILGLVLTYIEPCKNDLLNCRLVAQSWNNQTVKILKKIGWTISLDESNLFEYKTLLRRTKFSRLQKALRIRKSRSSSQQIPPPHPRRRRIYSTTYLHLYAPIHTKQQRRALLDSDVPAIASMDLSLNLNNKGYNYTNLQLLVGVATLLAQYPHLRVVSLQYAPEQDHDGDDDDDESSYNIKSEEDFELNKILTHALPTLKTLGFDTNFFNCHLIPGTITKFLTKTTTPKLQHLSSLALHLHETDDDVGYCFNSSFFDLLQAIPTLTSFSCTGKCIVRLLKSFNFQSICILKKCLSNITELQIQTTVEKDFNLFRSLHVRQLGPFTACTTLKIIQEETAMHLPAFASFLNKNYPSVNRVELTFNPYKYVPVKNSTIRRRERPWPVQALQVYTVQCLSVTTLCLRFNSRNDSTDDDSFNATQALLCLMAGKYTFPNLTTIGLDLDAIYYLSSNYNWARELFEIPPEYQVDFVEGTKTMPNVVNLKVWVPNIPIDGGRRAVERDDEYDEPEAEMLSTIFPNVANLEIVVQDLQEQDDDEDDDDEVDDEFERKPLTQAEVHSAAIGNLLGRFCRKLTSLTIDNYAVDWLGQFYDHHGSGSYDNLNGLRHLKLSRALRNQVVQSTTTTLTTTTTTNINKSGLTTALEQNLELQLLEIDSGLFRQFETCNSSTTSNIEIESADELILAALQHRKLTHPNLKIDFI